MQTKAIVPRSIALEAEQAIGFLTTISELLKHQRRHFDDAVVMHCIRLINDYVAENVRDVPPEVEGLHKEAGRRS